jgi:hypothetical protein
MAKSELFVRKQSGGMFSIVNESLTTGSIFFVDSVTGSSAGGYNPDAPAATIAQAYALCTAGKGDRIYVMPSHAENISHATTGLSCTKAGVRIIGLGDGDGRPTITLDTANTASIAVSAASNSFENIVFVANFLSIAACFTLAAAKAFALRNCEFRETSGVLNFLNIVKSTGAANTVDRLTLIGNTWRGLGTTSVNSFVLTANDIDGLTLLDNKVTLERTATAAALCTVTAGVLSNLDCGNNRTYTKQTATTGGGLISVGGTTSTGCVYRNFQQTLGTATDILFTTTVGLGAFENRVSGAVGATGFVIPAVDS